MNADPCIVWIWASVYLSTLLSMPNCICVRSVVFLSMLFALLRLISALESAGSRQLNVASVGAKTISAAARFLNPTGIGYSSFLYLFITVFIHGIKAWTEGPSSANSPL